jgi:ribonuclease H / adenosylcobalamin/alpha-ribazole phosphatase
MTVEAHPGSPIWLVRHAPTAWTGRRWCGRADPPLSAEGQRLAADLARRLANELPRNTLVVTSPSRRARATASAVAAAAGLELTIDDELVEVDMGRIEGLTWEDLSSGHPAIASAILTSGSIDWPDGESAQAIGERAARVATRLESLAATAPLVVVSHGAFLHALARRLRVVMAMSPGDAEAIATEAALEPCGVLRLVA